MKINQIKEENLNKDGKNKKFPFSISLILFISLVVLLIFFSTLSSNFRSFYNLMAMFTNTSFLVITVIGFTINLVAGEVDISIGANMAATSVVVAYFYSRSLPIGLSILMGLMVGVILGVINGLIITRFKVNSLIVTLGTMSIAQGIAYTLVGGRSILIMEDVLGYFGRGKIGPIPFPIVFTIILIILFVILLNYTKFGRCVKAVGSNPTVAFLSGINVKKIKFLTLLICAVMASVSGLLITSLTAVGMPQHGIGQEFPIISAVLLGGIPLAGGDGSIIGSVIGIIILSVIYNGLTMLNVSSSGVDIIRGLLLIIIVAAYELRWRKRI